MAGKSRVGGQQEGHPGACRPRTLTKRREGGVDIEGPGSYASLIHTTRHPVCLRETFSFMPVILQTKVVSQRHVLPPSHLQI